MEALGFDSMGKYIALTPKQIEVICFLKSQGKIDKLVGQEIVRLDSEVPNSTAELIDKTTQILDEADSIARSSPTSSSSTSEYPESLDGLSTDSKKVLIGKATVHHLKKWCKHVGIQRYSTMKKEELKSKLMDWIM